MMTDTKRRITVAVAVMVASLMLSTAATTAADERVTVEPDWGVAGHFGTWTVSYHVGEQAISGDGVVRVQLPDYWHAGPRNSAIRLQASDPTDDNYVRAYASRDEVKLETIVEEERERRLIKHAKESLDGRWERYVFVVRVTVEEGQLESGDRIDVVYGDTSGGSRGMTAPIIADVPQPILAAVDADGDGEFRAVDETATIRSRPGPPLHLWTSGPSDLAVGEQAELRFSIVDAWFNPVEDFEAEFQFRVYDGEAEIEQSQQVTLEHGGGSVRFTPTEPGVLRIDVQAENRLFEGRSNPMRVHEELPERQTYWGDLHSHTEHSWDGVGHSAFDYARYVTHLDFYAMADHSIAPREDGYTRGLGNHVWDEYTALTDAHHDSNAFVTIHAYEASFRSPYGHHNVYFRDDPGPLLAPQRVTLVQFWSALEAENALTIPHHTGKMPRPIEWHPHDSTFRRNIELYSAHGSSEVFDPEHSLSFERSDFTSPSRSARTPQFVQDAWAHGLKLSVIGASDDHYSQPGKPHYGLAAVRATELTRDAVFDGLYDRHTYATTGARILLDVKVNGVPMGRRVASGEPLEIVVRAHGQGVIEQVELLRYTEDPGDFEVVHELRPDAMDVEWRVEEPAAEEPTIYYVRLRERDGVLGRAVMAWSSPTWIDPE